MNGFRKMLKKATRTQIERFRRWYGEGKSTAHRLARDTGFTVYQAAGVISALSPLKHWDTNVKLAAEFMAAYAQNGTVLPVHFGNNVSKAADILASDGEPETVASFFRQDSKTWCFYHNLIGHLEHVTFDGHMLNCWRHNGSRAACIEGVRQPTKAQRAEMLQALQELATEYDLQPAEVQAVIWEVYRAQSL